MSSHSSHPVYDGLSLESGSIRLLEILPSHPDSLAENIAGRLRCASLADQPYFVALSYAWGDASIHDEIVLNGQRFEVNRSLYSALKHLQTADEVRGRALWIDAVCIDQDNTDERNHQVQQMRRIFAAATKTLIWLGPAAEESDLALDWMSRATAMSREQYQQLSRAQLRTLLDDRAWTAVCQLLERPWFRRRWVIQEAAISPDPVVFCGGKKLGWNRFHEAVEHIILIVRDGLFSSPSGRDASGNFVRMNIEPIISIENLRRRTSQGGPAATLFELLTCFRQSDCSQPQDLVFAVLGLCAEVEARAIEVDYDLLVEQVFIQQVVAHIRIYRDLDVLNACTTASRIPPPQPGEVLLVLNMMFLNADDQRKARMLPLRLPAWVPNWTSQHAKWILGPFPAYNGVPFHPQFDASGGQQAQVLNLDSAERSRLLVVAGVAVDHIAQIEEQSPATFQETSDPESATFEVFWNFCCARPVSQTPYRTEENRFNAFLRTLTVGGRNGESKSVVSTRYLRDECLRFWQDTSFGARLRREGFHESWAVPEEEYENLLIRAVMEGVVRASFHLLRFFRLVVTRQGWIGLADPFCQVGDEIVLLVGNSSLSNICRSPAEPGQYCLRGEAYIHGLMYGKVLKMVERDELRTMTITLAADHEMFPY